MTLPATFSLTPRTPYYYAGAGQYAYLYAFGADFYALGYDRTFEEQHAQDRLYFYSGFAADPTLDYATWTNRKTARYVQLSYNLSSLDNGKELALIFGFEARSESRLLIFTLAGLLADEIIVPGDNQFLMEIESLGYLALFFIHARHSASSYGGNWFFKGISGYVV